MIRAIVGETSMEFLMRCCVAIIVFLLLCAFGMVYNAIPMDVPIKVPVLTREKLATLPLTNHAKSGHPERAMDAEAIRQVMLAGKCSPVEVYYCPNTETMIVTCPANDKTELALWVGSVNQVVITGYPFDTSRLAKNTDGCIGPMPIP